MSRISTWYKNLNPKKKLLVVFTGNALYWFVAYLLLMWVWTSEDRNTIGKIAFQAIFMGVFWTLFFNWRNVRAACKKKNHEQTN